jgi:hypothetical protein
VLSALSLFFASLIVLTVVIIIQTYLRKSIVELREVDTAKYRDNLVSAVGKTFQSLNQTLEILVELWSVLPGNVGFENFKHQACYLERKHLGGVPFSLTDFTGECVQPLLDVLYLVIYFLEVVDISVDFEV